MLIFSFGPDQTLVEVIREYHWDSHLIVVLPEETRLVVV